MSKAIYRNSLRSKVMIKQAFLELMNEDEDITKISITDIVNRANINRGTFYSHYENIDALINAVFADVTTDLNKVLNEFTPETFKQNPHLFFKSFSNHIIENKLFYTQIANSHNAKQHLDYLAQFINEQISSKYIEIYQDLDTNILHALADYFSNGMYGLYVHWLQGKINLTIDEITCLLTSIFNTPVNNK